MAGLWNGKQPAPSRFAKAQDCKSHRVGHIGFDVEELDEAEPPSFSPIELASSLRFGQKRKTGSVPALEVILDEKHDSLINLQL